MPVVRDLVTRLGFQVDPRGKARADGAIDGIKKRANDAAVQVRAMLAAFVGFQGLKSIANIADQMQSIEARLGMLPQSADGAAASFEHIAERASNAGQSIQAYSDFYLKAGNATQDFIKDQETLTKVVDGAAFALAASGATAASQDQAFFQLGQAIGSPTVQMEEMNTLIDVAPDMFRALGKAIPGANGNLKKFISTGQVTGKMLAEGLMKILPEFEDRMRNMPMTIGKAGVLIQIRFAKFVAGMNRESGAVTKVANFFRDAFDVVEKSLGDLVDFLGGPTNALKAFGIVLAAAMAPLVVSTFAGALALLVSPIGLVVAGLALLGLIIEDVYQWVTGGESVIGGFLGTFEDWKTATADLIQSLSELWDSIKAFWGQMANLGASVWDILVGLFTAYVGLIASGFEGVLNALSGMFDAWLANIKASFSAAWEILKTIAGSLWDVSPMKAWIDAIKGMIPAIKNYFLDMLSPVTDIFNKAAGFLGFGDSGSDQAANTAAPVYGPEVPVVAPGGNSTNVNQTINVTVPPGTPEQQQQAIKDGASKAFGDPMNKLTNGMGTYTR